MGELLEFIFGTLMLATPILLVGGWVRWSKSPDSRYGRAGLAFVGFSLATASAVLAIIAWIVAVVRPLPFSHPLSLLTYLSALLLSIVGIGTAVAGISEPGPLRWIAPMCVAGTAAFWFMFLIGQFVS